METAANEKTMNLSNATLSDLPGHIQRPLYNRADLRPGIVHIGVGNFHRAHQAWYLHRLMQMGQALDWAIIGAGVRPTDAMMRDKLLAQDCLTSLLELSPAGSTAEVTGAMIDFLPIEETNAALIATLSDPTIRIVSLTVTEGGYFIKPETGALDVEHPDIRHDAAHPDSPRTAFGALVAALRARRLAGHLPFTAQCCDNLQGNGDILRRVVCSLAEMTDPDLADWIDQAGAFPNSMVDCIVPATGAEELALARRFGLNDAAPVTHENFRQWVIEDHFCAGRPAWEQVGAILTNDVHAYETMKIRILNAGHQVLANAGELLSLHTIAECMSDAVVTGFFNKVQREEIAPYVRSVPDMLPQAYIALISERFRNPAIRDTTRRVAYDGSARHPGFVLPVLRDALQAEGSITGLALVEALWCKMCRGVREDGQTIAPNDPNWDVLQIHARQSQTSPQAWLEQQAIYGSISNNPLFSNAFENALGALDTLGVEQTLKAYIAGENGL